MDHGCGQYVMIIIAVCLANVQTRTSKGNIFGLAWHYIVLAICLWKNHFCLSINTEESVSLVWIVLNYMYFIMSALWLMAAARLGL